MSYFSTLLTYNLPTYLFQKQLWWIYTQILTMQSAKLTTELEANIFERFPANIGRHYQIRIGYVLTYLSARLGKQKHNFD